MPGCRPSFAKCAKDGGTRANPVFRSPTRQSEQASPATTGTQPLCLRVVCPAIFDVRGEAEAVSVTRDPVAIQLRTVVEDHRGVQVSFPHQGIPAEALPFPRNLSLAMC